MEKNSKTVKSKLFQESDFFKSNDRGQVKYEMLRAHCHEGRFITRACKEFGYSRESFYQAFEAFRKEGMTGLGGRHKGKTKPDKVTPEIIGYAIYQRAKYGLSGAVIAKKVLEEFKLKLHKRTIERILSYYGILKR